MENNNFSYELLHNIDNPLHDYIDIIVKLNEEKYHMSIMTYSYVKELFIKDTEDDVKYLFFPNTIFVEILSIDIIEKVLKDMIKKEHHIILPFYSLNKESLDKIYEYNKSNIERHLDLESEDD